MVMMTTMADDEDVAAASSSIPIALSKALFFPHLATISVSSWVLPSLAVS